MSAISSSTAQHSTQQPIQQPSSLNTLGRFIFWLSLIVAAIAVYYFVLIERGSDHVYRRNFRSLTQVERQINTGFDRFAQVASTQSFDSIGNKKNETIKEKKIAGHTYPLQMIGDSADSVCAKPNNAKSSADMLFSVNALGGNALLDLCIRPNKDKGYVFAEDVPLADFINAGEALRQFHQLLVFDGDRNLIYRSGDDTADVIKTNVYALLAQNVTTHEALVALPDSWLQDEVAKKPLIAGKESEKKGEKAESAKSNSSAGLIPFSKVREFTIGEQKYLAFLRPMKLDYATIAQPGETPTWYVVGITTVSEFNASRFVIPRWWMAIFLLALALFILSTPYLKLRLLGPRDLIRSSTISLTVVAMLLAAMITTIMLLNLSAYLLTENNIRHQLRSNGQLLSAAFASELDTKKKALDQIVTHGPKQIATHTNAAENSQFIRTSVFGDDAKLKAIWNPSRNNKPNSYSIKNRNFWQQLTQHSALPTDNSDLTYSLDHLISRVDGRKLTVLAQRVARAPSDIAKAPGWTVVEECENRNDGLACEKDFSVVTGVFIFKAFSHALLPKGYGFIVIDNSTGTAQYHSEAGADLIEQLYEETDNNPALKTAINTGSPDTFITNYRGYRYLFHTRPLAYSRWTLVTYFSQELLDRVSIDLLLSATGLCIGFLILYMTAGLIGFKALSHSKINLLWPNPRQTHGYRLLLLLLSTLTLAVAAAIAQLHADQLFCVIAIAPLAALSGAYICLVRRYQPFQTLITTQNVAPQQRDEQHELQQPPLGIGVNCVTLTGAAISILCALLAVNNSWPWRLLPYTNQWSSELFAHGSGPLIALLLMTAAYFTLRMGLRNATKNYRNTASDSRRALLLLVLLTASIVLIANLMADAVSSIAAILVAAALIATLTQPLWTRDSIATNRCRCKFYLPIDRRTDRGQAYTLHRLCITLIIAVLVVLPAVAFYRDATSLYLLRWRQQDAQKFRAQIERLLENASLCSEKAGNCNLAARFERIVGANEEYRLLASNHATAADTDTDKANFAVAPIITLQAEKPGFTERDSAEARLMHPISSISHRMARISGFSKIENNAADDAQFSTWQVTDVHNGQHLLGALKLSYADYWLQLRWQQYADFGALSKYQSWIALVLAIFAAAVIYPMVRLILRELVAEADLRPHPALTTTELDLLLKNQRSTLLLVSGNALDKSTDKIADLENETVSALQMSFAQPAGGSREPIIAALPDQLTDNQVASDIMVVAEQRWQTLATEQSLHKTVRTHIDDANPPTWEAFLEGISKLRYPDDISDLAMDHWTFDRSCTLLICRNIEAQTTLAAYAAQHDWQPLTLHQEHEDNKKTIPISGSKIWLHHIEEIIFDAESRAALLEILEDLRSGKASYSLIMTSLVLPHLWFSDKASGSAAALDAHELTRWLVALTCINVRTVNALTIEQSMPEVNRSYHALPRSSREAEYALWWQYSTPDERTALAALTHEGLINPYNRSVIRSLMARGLIFRGSTLRFSDKAFKVFVKYRYPVTQLHREADIELQKSSWGAARGPMLITLAIAGYGIMVMGGGAFESILGLTTAIGASIPVLLNFAKLIKREPTAT